ncbi:antibiotic biosynthesis monooxygenase [Mesorhizobium sp.]|uniref:antibiotic biosynthesis monooxygenase family protein n=2 Tax=Mesorhizobium sp. TaxID=1871066 RepID=UPI000FEA62E8|nr:antibiotic biosynthesis monooxygenase [Mesorhizobium sp.]RWM45460.1 MAG: hypothetical protein EOR76_20640 [Mesorhizobium sp.]RWM58220.1 MAG: hypothetical protein EOR79_14545 [Mesorhizobium sp.]RWM58615.1 MAG: hypothetical protein EOR78_05730 [Mesorhizobium sp.]TIO70086.1 MAG: hypothetical protein E5X85_08090 [Mesorhizobium sp.]TIR18326.1 MAG: hypothetical protein E5X64_21565 [Mesorhizobium sp.]
MDNDNSSGDYPMYIRIYWSKIYPGSWPAIEDRYNKLMQIPIEGLKARFVSQDVEDEESIFTITIWDKQESIVRWEASDAYREFLDQAMRPLTVGSQSVSLCKTRLYLINDLQPQTDV